ncbi:MAG: hypothetical protein BGO45_01490 [Microbacterium sp. 71-36]|uniref:hypothetical protein n=1 Tax=unclassified Microbacterium TaxID=2609290 RepID=UPI00086B88AA|nr:MULTISPECIES: hypothetical protein [unclassified Microbacterium]MBN9211864.1 hypothetical protein [Microbacterium sp.]ODT37799.1 MAG: hypothetical protein ABS60_12065 [Microbacterium sp. SCN 71-17]ODU50849.1 MAG: hypothetical protein ABT07_03040 [Microbacterium sp. SCN 70-10]OJV76260.1 MAG: hypothetical protein BGO45_01490 [Microbacterium sp. 71-36]
MNEELTPDERAAMRARLVDGARNIAPAGAHRNAWIAGSIAAVLVVAIAGGVVATSTLSAPQIANTPSPTATVAPVVPTPSPTPTPTPSPTTVVPAIAFGGDCGAVLDDDAVSAIVGVPMVLSNGVSDQDAGVLGGVRCQWRATGDGYQAVGVSVFPWEVVPADIGSQAGVVPDCALDGYSCQYLQRFGDAAVTVWGSTTAQLTALADAVGERAALSPGAGRPLPAAAWAVPECDVIRDAIDLARGRSDIVDHRGDYSPHGFDWDLLVEHGAAAYCAVDNLSAPEGKATVVDVMFGPGSSPDLDAISRYGGIRTDVAGADAAWYLPDFTSTASLLVVQSGPNTLSVGTESMTEEEMAQVGAAVIAALG